MDDLQNWLLEHGTDREADETLRNLVSDLGSDDYALSDEGFRRFNLRVRKERRRRTLRWTERVAAALFLPLVVLALFFALRRPAPVEWEDVYTATGQSRSVVLSDGSSLRLAPGSHLIYPKSFSGDVRKVFLEGEVYADITHDARTPFEIHSEGVVVSVYGTQFHFSSYQTDSECELALVDGSVQMEIEEEGAGHTIRLNPGEMVRYDRKSGSVDRQHFSSGGYQANEQKGGLQFINRRMDDIVRCLERRFNVRIVIEDKEIGEERFYASFVNGEDLMTILSSLNTQNYMKIHQKEGRIVLSLK